MNSAWQPEARARIAENVHRLSFHLDLDGTLTQPGQPLPKRAIKIILRLRDLDVPLSCNITQSHGYLLAAGGNVFLSRVTNLGFRVQHVDGSVDRAAPPKVDLELEMAREFLKQRPDYNVLLVEKTNGFSFKLSNADGIPASPRQVEAVTQFAEKLVAENEELSLVQTTGAINLCSSLLSKRFGVSELMAKPPFHDTFSIGAGTPGPANARMFELCEWSLQIGNGNNNTTGGGRAADMVLENHHEMLEFLEWIVDIRSAWMQQTTTAAAAS